MAGMKGDEALAGIDRIIIAIGLIIGKALHQNGLGGPFRIGMEPLNSANFLVAVFIVPAFQV